MRKVVRIPAGNTTYVHYNFVMAKPLVIIKGAYTLGMEGARRETGSLKHAVGGVGH